MDKKQAKERIEKLKEEIRHYSYLYHVLDQPDISDSAFDTLKNELEELELKFSDLITPDSPTQRVSGEALDKFKKFKHPAPMLSFNDAFSRDETREWSERNYKIVGDASEKGYYCELKIFHDDRRIDGLLINIDYLYKRLFNFFDINHHNIILDINKEILSKTEAIFLLPPSPK